MQSLSYWLERRRRVWRARRLRAFVRLAGARPGERVLDLGGNVEWWSLCREPYDVTLFNLKAEAADSERPWLKPANGTRWRIEVGDAADLSRYEDASFDWVFSNSLIEHLGDDERVARFAAEVRRVGKGYWVQTPAGCFPVEAHTGIPGFWALPSGLRGALARRIDARRAAQPWACSVVETRCIGRRQLRGLFPDGRLHVEWLAGWPKSWSMYRRGAA